MGYIRKWWDTPNGRVVEEYHSGGAPPPGGRGRKRKATPEAMAKANQRQKERNARILIMANFRENDYYVTLTYRKDERPGSMEECKKQFTGFMTKVKRMYRKAGYEVKWIRNIEKGSRGGWHIHLIINRIPDADVIIRKAWSWGGVHMSLLYAEGGYKDLAEYISKSEAAESSYSTSRNLERPQPKKKKMSGKTFEGRKIRIPQGHYLDKGSYYEGINGYTGYPYRYYTLLILTDRRRE